MKSFYKDNGKAFGNLAICDEDRLSPKTCAKDTESSDEHRSAQSDELELA
jgi:hypothetical protein